MAKLEILSEIANNSLQPTAKINSINSEEVKSYFTSLYNLVLEKGEDEFCVDLDDVFHYAYKAKKEAVRALTKSDVFINGYDYIVVRKAAQGQFDSKTKILMTMRCFEFFIVKKNRTLFEVYRSIFHFVLAGNIPKQIINVTPIGIIDSTKSIESKNNVYPVGYNSIKQILRSLGYKHIKPRQVFKILVERGLLRRERKTIVIRKNIDLIYAEGKQLENKSIINRNEINSNTTRNQLLFKESEIIRLLDIAGISLSNEEALSKIYQ